jgi:tetratricopeptide (TPR) repeat protein
VRFSLAHALALDGEQSEQNEPLAESIKLYRKVLDEYPRARAPMGHDPEQSRQCASDTRRAGEEAVAAFRDALQEWTRAHVPLQWAMTQMNLALVYRALFDKDHQPGHLGDALEAADGALEEFRKANAAFYIEKAERQRGEILAAKGKLNHAGTRPKRLGRDN